MFRIQRAENSTIIINRLSDANASAPECKKAEIRSREENARILRENYQYLSTIFELVDSQNRS